MLKCLNHGSYYYYCGYFLLLFLGFSNSTPLPHHLIKRRCLLVCMCLSLFMSCVEPLTCQLATSLFQWDNNIKEFTFSLLALALGSLSSWHNIHWQKTDFEPCSLGRWCFLPEGHGQLPPFLINTMKKAMASERDKVFLTDAEEAVEGGNACEERQCYKYLPRQEFPVSLIQHTS